MGEACMNSRHCLRLLLDHVYNDITYSPCEASTLHDNRKANKQGQNQSKEIKEHASEKMS